MLDTGSPLGLDKVAAEVLLGSKRIVHVAAQREVGCAVWAATRARIQMMVLEKRGFAATLTSAVDKGATPAVPGPHLTLHARRHMSAPALALALARLAAVKPGLGLPFPLALARCAGLVLGRAVTLALALALARVSGWRWRGLSRLLHGGAATLLQL